MKKFIPILLALAAAAEANIISWNYDNNGTVTGPNQVAGVQPAVYWNNSWPANPTVDLTDTTGAATTLDLAYTSFNGWRIQNSHPGTDADGSYNKELLNGYLNAGPAGWSPPITSSSVALTEIPYAGYSVIVYFSSDAANREGQVTDGTTTYYFSTVGAPSIAGANATFTRTTQTDDSSYPVANYAIFSGLSGASQTITVQMRDNDEWAGIAGFQVVANPPELPEFVVHPEGTFGYVGDTVTLNSSAISNPAPTYQWHFSADGQDPWVALSGKTSASLVIEDAAISDTGFYRVVATNAGGSVTSNEALLDISYDNPRISAQPGDVYAELGSNPVLSVSATGYGTLSYRWFKDGEVLTGATAATLTLTGVDAGDEGEYQVEITDSVAPDLVTLSATARVYTFTAWSGLASHDPFSIAAGYAAGELPLQNPAVTGYADAWADVNFGDAEPAVVAGSLAYADPLYLGSSGDQVGNSADTAGINGSNSGRAYRLLSPALVVAPTTSGVRYLSWLYKNGNENAAANAYTHSTLALYHNTGGAAPAGDAAQRVFSAGISDADYGSTNFGFRCNDTQVGDLLKAPDANVHLFVAKFELGTTAGADRVTVWIDPALGAGEPAGGVTIEGLDMRFESLALSDYASNSSAWDEVRWGSSFDSVTLNTNPAPDFATWIAGYPGVGALNGVDDDADRDGIANGVENFFGTDPSVSGKGITEVSRTGNTLILRHPQGAALASDLTATWRWSTDLVNWHANGATVAGTTVAFASSPGTPAAGTTTVTATISGTVPAKLFTGVRVAP